jgi:hypothetical protein
MNKKDFQPAVAHSIHKEAGASSRHTLYLGQRFAAALLYRDGLRQVPRLVYIAAATDSDVVREQLQRNNFNQR